VDRRLENLSARALNIDMSRGRLSSAQLALSAELLELPGRGCFRSEDGSDCRNYGRLAGLPEARRLMGGVLRVPPAQVLVQDNSSLRLMHDALVFARLGGVPGADEPWTPPLRIICPVPGYDRHFKLSAGLGFELVPVDLGPDGPDMDQVERLVSSHPTIRAMWCMPRYSNPTGTVFSDDIVRRLAAMKAAAPDFRLLWDHAYAIHGHHDDPDTQPEILTACQEAGHPDRALVFGSLSKVTMPGAGIAAVAASPTNVAWMERWLSRQTVCPNKINQLRHVLFLRDAEGVRAHMIRHAELLRPRFAAVDRALEEHLGSTGLAHWSRPRGGYFVSLDTAIDGCARDVVALAGRLGVRLTQAGATFPHGDDPRDRNIRIAPTAPESEDLGTALEVLVTSVQRVSLDRLLARR